MATARTKPERAPTATDRSENIRTDGQRDVPFRPGGRALPTWQGVRLLFDFGSGDGSRVGGDHGPNSITQLTAMRQTAATTITNYQQQQQQTNSKQQPLSLSPVARLTHTHTLYFVIVISI